MELNKQLTTVVNKMEVMQRAQENLLPSVTGEPHELAVALISEKIAQASDEKVKESLRYCMLLVGLKESTIKAMTGMEKQVMINYLRKHFGGHTCKEINLAFEKAIAGELPIEPKDVKAYENFSCIYIGNILRAYRVWAKTEFKEGGVAHTIAGYEKDALPVPVQTDEERFDFWKAEILGGINVDFIPSDVFELITNITGIEPSDAGITKALLKAQGHILSRLGQEKAIKTEDKHPARYWEITKDIQELNEPMVKWRTRHDVQKLAKAFWCQSYFLHTNLQLPKQDATTTNSQHNAGGTD